MSFTNTFERNALQLRGDEALMVRRELNKLNGLPTQGDSAPHRPKITESVTLTFRFHEACYQLDNICAIY